MSLILDAGPIVALADRRDRMQPQVEALLRAEDGEIVVPAPVTAEVDYLLGRRLGRPAPRRAALLSAAPASLRNPGTAVACRWNHPPQARRP